MALLPYSVRQVTQRSKGRRDRDRDRGDRDAPMEAAATEAEAADTEAVEEGLDHDEFEGDGAAAPETELAAEEE